jgi:hypothetical protein
MKTQRTDQMISCILQFLSMKLAAVNPQLGLNIEGILSKDLIRFPGAPPSAPIGFSLSQSGMVQEGVHGVAGSNGFRTVMQGQLNERDSFREHVSQVCKAEHRISFRSL